MELQQVAALADIAASIGVIVSLVYLARQLTQNTAMMKVAAASERVERDYQIVVPILLNDTEQVRLLFFERQAIVLWHHLFGLRTKGILPDSDWHEHVWIIRNLGQRQAVRAAWSAFAGAYEKPFQDFVNEQFAAADAGRGSASTDA